MPFNPDFLSTFDGASPRHYQPTYAGANMGHPFRVGVSERVDYQGTSFHRPWVGKATCELQGEPHGWSLQAA